MSGTCTFMLRSVLEDITVELSEVTCSYFDQVRSMMYFGMRSGEIVALRIEQAEGKVTAQASLFLSPGFELSNTHVVALTVAEMPFSMMTVKVG